MTEASQPPADPIITDLRVVKARTGLTEVSLNGEMWAQLEPDVVVLFGLQRGQALGDERQVEILKANDRLRARQVLARYTALTVRSERQCRMALARRGFDEETIDEALAYGQARQWLDDAAFAGAFVRQRGRLRPSGPRKLRADLAGKGIGGAVADEAIEAFGPDRDTQWTQARAEGRRRYAIWRERYDRDKLRRKLLNHLARQGYDGDMVVAIVDELLASFSES